MKKINRIIKLLCCIFTVAFIFCSCESNPVDDYPFIPFDSEIKEEMSEISVIIPNGSSSAIVNAADSLCDAIKKKIDIPTYRKNENDIISKNSYVVLLGNFKSGLSELHMRDLRIDDYVCIEDGETLILGGRTDTATLNAIERFKNEILPVSDIYTLIPHNGGFIHKGEYAISKYLLNGTELVDYKISINSNKDHLKESALKIQKVLAEQTGYWLDIVVGADYNDLNGSIIRIEIINDSQGNGIARITPTEKGLVLSANDETAIELCCDKFIDLILDDTDVESVEKSIEKPVVITFSTSSATVFSYIHDDKNPISALNAASIFSPILQSSPDFVLLGKLDPVSGKVFSENLTRYKKSNVTNDSIYTYSNYNCKAIYYKESGGLTLEGYEMNNNELAFVLLRISGRTDEETEIEIPENIKNSNLPKVIIVHTLDSKKIRIADPSDSYLTKVIEKSGKYFSYDTHFSCYSDIEGMSVELIENLDKNQFKGILVTGSSYVN